MNVRNITLALLAASALLAAPAAVMAQEENQSAQPHRMMRCERPAPCLTAEQAAQMKQLRTEHHAAMSLLREKHMQKRMELRALSPNPNVKPEELKALVGEIMSLRKQMHDLRAEYRTKLEKAGLPTFGMHGPRGPRFHHDDFDRKDCFGPRGGHDWNGDCPPRHGRHGNCPVQR